VLDSLFRQRKWNNVFGVANSDIISLIKSEVESQKRKRIRQAVDIQYYTYKYIQAGLLDPKILCGLDYPNESLFYGLKLGYYAMMEQLSQKFELDCFLSANPERKERPMALFGEEELGAFIKEAQREKPTKEESLKDQPSFDSTPKADYHYFLKTLFLTNDKSIKRFVSISDNLIEFDLYHLLSISVDQWDPFSNYYYDKDITFKQMNGLIKKLKAMDGRICQRVVNQLYLDYHLKALQHLKHRLTQGDGESVMIADESMRFISAYYAKNWAIMFPALASYIVQGLTHFYWLPSRKASIEYCFDLIKSIKKHPWAEKEFIHEQHVYERMLVK
jgi:hypothetical protein